MTERFSVRQIPKQGAVLVVLRDSTITAEQCGGLAHAIGRKNPDAILVVLRDEADIACLPPAESMQLVSRLTDRMTAADLERIGLRRIVS
ncbi:MAG: hypothetical protein M0Z28_27465 [Rhodospirillales bacterium]|nr:hypothetical protein [Rhodospirillales bacterium]